MRGKQGILAYQTTHTVRNENQGRLLLAWLLLTPFFEESNYLLYVDARARYEGLDLWYRVRRHFPLPAKTAGAYEKIMSLPALNWPVTQHRLSGSTTINTGALT